jgi:CRP/FNR family transcriptional regulator
MQVVAPKVVPLRCDVCAIRHRAVCGALSNDELAMMNSISRQRVLAPGEPILSAGDQVTWFGNIVSGTVKLTKLLSDGRQQIVGLQFPPDFLGRAFKETSPYFAEAATEVELCTFPKAAFEKILKEKPDLEFRLFQDTLDELDAARDWMLLLGRKTAAEKVASFLEMIARRSPMIGCAHHANDEEIRFQMPLTRSEIADYLGLTIETVSRQIGRLKADGILQLHATREFSVMDIERLAEVSGA